MISLKIFTTVTQTNRDHSPKSPSKNPPSNFLSPVIVSVSIGSDQFYFKSNPQKLLQIHCLIRNGFRQLRLILFPILIFKPRSQYIHYWATVSRFITFFLFPFTYLIATPDRSGRSDRLSTPTLGIPMLSLQRRASSLRYHVILHNFPCNLQRATYTYTFTSSI